MQDLNDKITGGTLTATEWNEVPSEIQAVIEGINQTLTSGDLNQLGKAIAGYAANGTFYVESGVADAYLLSVVGSKQRAPTLTNGFTINFVAGNSNTGASTINVAGLGVKNLKTKGGDSLPAEYLQQGDLVAARFDGVSFIVAKGSSDFVKKVDNLALATSSLELKKNDTLLIKEPAPSTFWDVVLTSSVTPDGDDIIQSSGIPSLSLVKREVRPTVSFIFDDGYTSAITDVLPLFKSKGMTCGFAIIATLTDSSSTTYANVQAMLNAQAEGFEIINHGLDPTPMPTNADGVEFARSQINGNYDKLRQFGFNVQSFVAGNSTLASDFIPIVKERHSSAYTVDGSSNVGQAGLQDKPVTPYDLFRPSLFVLGLANAKLTVDAAKESNGWVTFYDHDPTQVFFPGSMDLVDLEELLDYCISEGVQVVNPTQARQQLGNEEYRLNQEAINESNREQSLTLVNQNLLRDPWYKTIQEDYAGWNKSASSGDGTFTPANRSNGVFGNEIQLTVASNGTVVDGQYVYQSNAQRRGGSFFPTSGNLTFSCEPYQTAAAFDDNFELTIGVNQRKTSDNSLLEAVESLPLKIDTRARKYSVTIDPIDYDNATYFQVYYRITEKIVGVGASVLIANPKLEQGSVATRYTADAPVDINDWDLAEAVVDVGATGVISDTQLELSAVNNNFYQIVNDQFLCRDTGFYFLELAATGVSSGPWVNVNTIVKTVKNNVTETKILERVSNGARLTYDHTQLRHFKSGETMHYLLSQAASGGALNLDTGVRSYLKITKVG